MKAAVTQETDAHNNFKKKKGVEGEHASSSQKFVLPKDPPSVELSSSVTQEPLHLCQWGIPGLGTEALCHPPSAL